MLLAPKGGSLVAKEDSPTAKELKLALEVNGIASLSCDGQERKLAKALGLIITKKHGIEIEVPRVILGWV
jgi:hypothetical protein